MRPLLHPLLVSMLLLQEGDSRPNPTLLHDGLIEPYRTIQLSPAVDGVLETVLVERGDVVHKGQVVARLESSVEEANLALAKAKTELVGEIKARKASLEFNDRKSTTDENLSTKGVISEFEAEQSRTDKILAEAGLLQTEESMHLAHLEYERARAVFDLRTIESPIDGVVVERLLSPGELATRQSQSVIAELAQIDPLNIEVILPVSMYGQIQPGTDARVFPQPPISGDYAARVTVVDRVVDAESGTFRVRLELPNPDSKLPAGIRCQVRFNR